MKKIYQTPTMETTEAVYLATAIMSGDGGGKQEDPNPFAAPAHRNVF